MRVIAIVLALVASVVGEPMRARADFFLIRGGAYGGTFTFQQNNMDDDISVATINKVMLKPGKYLVAAHETMEAAEDCTCSRTIQLSCPHGSSFNMFIIEVANNTHTIHQLPSGGTLKAGRYNSIFRSAIIIYDNSMIVSGKKIPKKARVASGYVKMQAAASLYYNVPGVEILSGILVFAESAENEGVTVNGVLSYFPPAEYTLAMHDRIRRYSYNCHDLPSISSDTLPLALQYADGYFNVKRDQDDVRVKVLLPNATLQEDHPTSIVGRTFAFYDVSTKEYGPEEPVFNVACGVVKF